MSLPTPPLPPPPPVLCSTMQPVSHTTLQFTRYISLLERIQKLKEGGLDQKTLTEVAELISNLSKSPELNDPSVNAKLSSLMRAAMAGLSADTMNDYSCQVLDFVRTAMEWYPLLPVSPQSLLYRPCTFCV